MPTRYLKLILIGLVLYSAIAYYGDIKNLEVALNASETVTPFMLKEAVEAVNSYTMFLVILILASRK